MANPAKDDSTNYVMSLVLFTALVPVLFLLSWYLSPRGESTRHHDAPAPTAPAEPAAHLMLSNAASEW